MSMFRINKKCTVKRTIYYKGQLEKEEEAP